MFKMKPYFQDSSVTIYHGDCREILPQLPKVDLVLTDPPYGLGFEYIGYEDTIENLQILIKDIFPLLNFKRACISCGITNYYEWPKANWICSANWDTTGSYG